MKGQAYSGLAFGLSHLLKEKMAVYRSPTGKLNTNGGGSEILGAQVVQQGSTKASSSFYIQRCPVDTFPQLSLDGICSCGTAESGAIPCEKGEWEDQSAICVQDVRGGSPHAHRSTCGLEFYSNQSQEDCPMNYVRVASSKVGKGFICQDTASIYSCGAVQQDCSQRPGALRTECIEGQCEILVCKEGWRFKFQDSGASSSCVPARPLFFEG